MFSLTIAKFSLPMRTLLKERRLNALALLQHGRITHEVSKLLGIFQSTCSRICREYVSCVESSRWGRTRNITPAQQRVRLRAIIDGGLDNVVDVRNALSEHLNVVVSTNTMRRALHEVGLGALEKHSSCAKNVRCRFEFSKCREDWTNNIMLAIGRRDTLRPLGI
jgi:transposase